MLCVTFFFLFPHTMSPALINFFFRYITSPWVSVKSWMETGWLSHYIASDSEKTWRRKLCASSLLQRHRYLFTRGLYSLILTLQIRSVWCVKLKYLGLKVDWSCKVRILFLLNIHVIPSQNIIKLKLLLNWIFISVVLTGLLACCQVI